MVKKIFARLSVLILVLSISGCSVLFPEPQIITIRHVSNLTLHNSFLYFGAGYCLYELNVRNQDLREILCEDEWLFQRPAIDETRAYAQVMNSITGKRYFVAVELQSGALVWQVQEKSRQPYFPGLRQDTFLMGNMVVTARRDGIDVFGVDTGKRIWDLSDNYMDAYSYQIQDDLIWYNFCFNCSYSL